METREKRPARAAAPVVPTTLAEDVATTVEAAAIMPGPEPAALPPPEPVSEAPRERARNLGEEALNALGESQAVLAQGLEAMTAEIAGMAQAGLAATTESATALLAAKTLADAIDINARFARHSADTLIEGSAKLSEIAVKLAAEASRPLFTGFGKGWGST